MLKVIMYYECPAGFLPASTFTRWMPMAVCCAARPPRPKPSKHRPSAGNLFFQLAIEPGQTEPILIHVETFQGSLQPLELWVQDTNSFAETRAETFLVFGLIFGVLLALIFSQLRALPEPSSARSPVLCSGDDQYLAIAGC